MIQQLSCMEIMSSSSHLHSDSYNEHLLYARQIAEDDSNGLLSSDNPQEASATATTSLLPDTNHLIPPPSNESEETFIKIYLSRIITAIIALLLIGLVFVLLPYYAVHAAKNDKWNETLYWTAGVFVLLAVPISVHGIIQHLVNVSMVYMCCCSSSYPSLYYTHWLSLFPHIISHYTQPCSTICHKCKSMSSESYSWYQSFQSKLGLVFSFTVPRNTYVPFENYMKHSYYPRSFTTLLNYWVARINWQLHYGQKMPSMVNMGLYSNIYSVHGKWEDNLCLIASMEYYNMYW